jgi:SAM-dependent methyltransferase
MKACAVCSAIDFSRYCTDWQGNTYDRCDSCGFVRQAAAAKVDYQSVSWQMTVDPDGKPRNLLAEREKKLRDWYGGVVGFLEKGKFARVLDIGCGPGFMLSAVKGAVEKHGIELNQECAAYIKANVPEIEVKQVYLEKAGYPDRYFDAVVLYHVIEHLDDPASVLEEISRILDDRGTLVVGTPNMGSFCARRFKGNFRLLGSGHVGLFNKKNLVRLLEKNGFQVFRTEYPFFRTGYFNLQNLLRLFDCKKVSPPFWGSVMTLYAKKKVKK